MSDKNLHVDRTISFALILAILVQTAGALLWRGRPKRVFLNSKPKRRQTCPWQNGSHD